MSTSPTSPVAATVPVVPGLPGRAPIEPGPAAAELCGERGWPVVAAYDLADGSLGWSACSPEGGLFVMAAASEDTVWVAHFTATDQEYLAFDAGSGKELRRSTPAEFESDVPAEADKSLETPPVIDGVQLTGGQQDPMTGTDAATGTTLWTQPGHLAYDDVWAVGDRAVFAVENDYVPDKPTPPALVGYEVATGEVRWRHELDAYLWPFHVSGERLLVMWNNLQVLATDDGSVLWETNYPEPRSGFPRMMGGAVNSQSVFVSFTSEPSGGD
ncbi:MAG TPA: PQQ-binding-like beta-propeller repeat protein [Ilumatobacteraceae bacterium]|nr:PQQ-binding-like beta-propeller repeat protein [Ilumatobacteraceae bacterium]